MIMKRFLILAAFVSLSALAEDRVLAALQDKLLAEQVNRLKTDDRIALYENLVEVKPETLQYRVLLAGAYIQKMRETTDFSYVDRADKVLQAVLESDSSNYDALRLSTEVQLERHNFAGVVELSRRLVGVTPMDAWNWGTLGDAHIELGDYDQAADAYQRMMNIRPDLASYNRAAHYRFLNNDVKGAIQTMQLAISAGSNSSENVAWCWVELGAYYAKTGQNGEAERAYNSALQTFPNYHPAYAALGKIQAAKGETSRAIENLRRAQSITPLPDYAAALYDLYMASGQKDEAVKQKQLIEVIDRLGRANGEKANRNLALIYADHDWNLDRSLDLATAELEYRHDVYTYDALAWALYKNGKLSQAAKAMDQALKLNTPEPGFKRHAQLIHEANQPATASKGQ
jgi:tetratricopeptide (TPR) repeat protein